MGLTEEAVVKKSCATNSLKCEKQTSLDNY
jgi:hypothetical protein